MLRLFTVIILLALPATSLAQELVYARQFGSLANGMAADDTGSYVTVDSTRQVFPGSTLLNKAITLRKFSNASGVEEWSREVFTNENAATAFPPRVALDSSGVYVSITVNAPDLSRRAVVRKFGRDGSPMWSTQLSTSSFEAVIDVATANGVVYAVTVESTNQGMLYAVNAETGAVGPGQPVGTGDLPRRIVADGSGVYVVFGLTSAVLSKFSHAGVLQWDRQLLPTALSADALFVHATGIYAGGYSFSGQNGFLARYDSDGNLVSTLWIEPDHPVLDFVEIRAVTADSAGFYVGGRFRGTLDGEPTVIPNQPSAYARKYSFDGQVVWTKVIDEGTGTIFQLADMAVAQGGLQLTGRSQGTFPGNAEDSGARAILARISLPTAPLLSVSAILDELGAAVAGGFTGRISAICTQLEGLRREVQRSRGTGLPAADADLLISRIGDAEDIIGCRP
jgi:outer membrane protein assembly factor BamB